MFSVLWNNCLALKEMEFNIFKILDCGRNWISCVTYRIGYISGIQKNYSDGVGN